MEEKYYLGIALKLADFEVKHWLFHRNEWWKDIQGFEGYYQVSTLGRAKSIERIIDDVNKIGLPMKKKIKGKILKNTPNKGGYLIISLSKEGIVLKQLLHRIILKTFIGDQDGVKNEVNHKDLNPGNSALSNLEYVDSRENSFYSSAIRRGEEMVYIFHIKETDKFYLRLNKFRFINITISDKDVKEAIERKNKFIRRIIKSTSIIEVNSILKEIKAEYNANKTRKRGQKQIRKI